MLRPSGQPAARRVIATVIGTAFLVSAQAEVSAANVFAYGRAMLWTVVHGFCVPAETLFQVPTPCTAVDISLGEERGFAVVAAPLAVAVLLLVPTIRISGIEDPVLLKPGAPNYWAAAWAQRGLLATRIGRPVARQDVAMAVNSMHARTQDQLHIHVSCVRSEVKARLASFEPTPGAIWSPVKIGPLHLTYLVRTIDADALGAVDRFRLLADEVPGAQATMAEHTLVVVGSIGADGRPGFFVLDHKANRLVQDEAMGEQLLDPTCNTR